MSGEGTPLDLYYLRDLGPAAIPAIDDYLDTARGPRRYPSYASIDLLAATWPTTVMRQTQRLATLDVPRVAAHGLSRCSDRGLQNCWRTIGYIPGDSRPLRSDAAPHPCRRRRSAYPRGDLLSRWSGPAWPRSRRATAARRCSTCARGGARSRRARYRHAGDGRAGGLPADPQDLRRADPVPVGARRGDRPHPRARDRRRRLCHQAVQPARAGGARQRHPQARAAARREAAAGADAWPAVGSTPTRTRSASARQPSPSPRSSSRSSGACWRGPSRCCQPRAADGGRLWRRHLCLATAPSTATSATSAPSSPRRAAPAVIETVHGVGFRLGSCG